MKNHSRTHKRSRLHAFNANVMLHYKRIESKDGAEEIVVLTSMCKRTARLDL